MSVAVLLTGYGAASAEADVPAYLADIRGRPADQALIDEVLERYRLIGGSPLLEISRAQGEALERRLDRAGSGEFRVFLAMRHSAPRIEDVVRTISAKGFRQVVVLPLTPYFGTLSTGPYFKAYQAALHETGARFETFEATPWNLHPRLIGAFAGALEETLAGRPGAQVLFTAHSLPERIREAGDPYPEALAQTAAAVSRRAGLGSWSLAYQSRGRTSEPWLGPDAADAIRGLAAAGCRDLVLAPIGFISDHLETLYDVDLLYRAQAEGLGLRLARPRSLNTDAGLIEAMASAVAAVLRGQSV